MSVLITIFLGILIVRLIVKDSNFTSKPNFIFKMLDTLAESKDKIYFSINKESVGTHNIANIIRKQAK